MKVYDPRVDGKRGYRPPQAIIRPVPTWQSAVLFVWHALWLVAIVWTAQVAVFRACP